MMYFRRYILRINLICAVMLLSACATQSLNSKISYEGSLRRELSIAGALQDDPKTAKDIKIRGQYYGLTRIDNVDYFMIGVGEVRAACGVNHNVELLIPTVDGIAGKLREVSGARGMSYGEVTILIPTWIYRSWDRDEKYKEILSWSGYPDTVILYYSAGITMHSRYGANRNEIRYMQIEDGLAWECRSKVSYYSWHLLYPFSIGYDVVTFPFQWLLWQAWH